MRVLLHTVAALVLLAGSAGAQQWEWNPDGTGQYGAYSGPGRPSLPDQSREYHRQAETADRQAEQWRQEALRQESERQAAAAAPARPYSYQEQYWVQGRDGRSTLCVPQYNKAIVSCY